MPTDPDPPKPAPAPSGAEDNAPAGNSPLPPPAERALAEAAARRAARGDQAAAPNEVGGPSGPEPTRYGDWEINGLAADF